MSFHPCNECGNEVRPRHQALQCDNCGFRQHRICGTGIDQAIYRLAIIRGRTDSLCVACSLAASNPGDQVPAAESTRTDFAQGTEILSSPFVPEINLFLTKNLTFLAWVLSWTFFSHKRVYDKNAGFIFALQIFLQCICLSTYWFSCSTERPLCAPSKFDSSTPENCKGSSVKNIAHFKQESLTTRRITLRVKFQVGDSLMHALT